MNVIWFTAGGLTGVIAATLGMMWMMVGVIILRKEKNSCMVACPFERM